MKKIINIEEKLIIKVNDSQAINKFYFDEENENFILWYKKSSDDKYYIFNLTKSYYEIILLSLKIINIFLSIEQKSEIEIQEINFYKKNYNNYYNKIFDKNKKPSFGHFILKIKSEINSIKEEDIYLIYKII